MRKSFLVAMVAAVAMAVAASSAAAVGISPAGGITATSAAPYTLTAAGGLISISCNVTLSGTLETSVTPGASSPANHAGAITSGSVANCNFPVVLLVSTSNPWEVVASSGSSAGLTGLLRNAQFQVSGLPIVGTCLVSGNVNIGINGPSATTITTAASSLGTTTCGITAADAGGQRFNLTPTQTLS